MSPVGISYRKQCMIPPKPTINAAASLRLQHSKKDIRNQQQNFSKTQRTK